MPSYFFRSGSALVIANFDYKLGTGLISSEVAKRSGELVGAALIELGFDVTFRFNVDRIGDELLDFVQSAMSSDALVVYFAGHGLGHALYGRTGEICNLPEFMGVFTLTRLIGKPKVIILDCSCDVSEGDVERPQR